MCGRYSFEATKKELFERYQLEDSGYEVEEREEIFPTSVSPIILPNAKLAFFNLGIHAEFL